MARKLGSGAVLYDLPAVAPASIAPAGSPQVLTMPPNRTSTHRTNAGTARRGGRWARLGSPSAAAATLALGAVAGCLGGCAFQQQRAEMHNLAARGDYALAAAELDRPATIDLYGQRNRLLWLLDRGAIALALGDSDRAIDLLSQAEAIMDRAREPSTSDTITSWLLNDSETTYIGEPYEDLYTNTLKLLAQLRAGRIEGAATVEARRAAGKADWLRDRFVRELQAVRTRGGSSFATSLEQSPLDRTPGATAVSPARPATTADGQFVESTLATYLTAITFMKAGEPQLQAVAGRRLADSIQLQGSLIGQVRPEPFANVGELRPAEVNVLLVALSGPAPVKDVQRVGPIAAFTFPVYFELPVLRAVPSRVASAEVSIYATAAETPAPANGEPDPDDAATPDTVAGPAVATIRLDLVESLSAVATENHRRQLPLIYARTLLRAGLKSGAAFAGAEVVRRRDKNGLATVGVVLGGLALLALTERADTRAWAFLPGQAHVAVTKLPPGRYTASVQYLGAGGGTVARGQTVSFVIADGPEALTTLVWHTAR